MYIVCACFGDLLQHWVLEFMAFFCTSGGLLEACLFLCSYKTLLFVFYFSFPILFTQGLRLNHIDCSVSATDEAGNIRNNSLSPRSESLCLLDPLLTEP